MRIIGMIESAQAMVRIHEIAAAGKGHLDALLFAAEDCGWYLTSTNDRLRGCGTHTYR